MPRIPRGLSGKELCRLLETLGYEVTRRRGSHIRLTALHTAGRHAVTVPDHQSVKIGTLNSILADIAEAMGIPRRDLMERLF